MIESPVQMFPPGMLFALVGNPNCGKTALFNRLTGSRQKVANYSGVTVERKEGRFGAANGRFARVLDLPGTYSLYPRSQDERITCDVLSGFARGEKRPDVVICVIDATNLRRSLRLFFSVQRKGLPCVIALNMMDEAKARGIGIDARKLSELLGVPVVCTVAVKSGGDRELRELIEALLHNKQALELPKDISNDAIPAEQDHKRVQRILTQLGIDHLVPDVRSARIDAIVMHPVIGPLLLVTILFLIFQAMFEWASIPMDMIEEAAGWVGETVEAWLPDGWIKSLIIDGIIAGAGGVLVFLPQILILFFFILVLEESGYLPRAAYLLDRIMGSVGLSGRSFIPLLSSFACAIPGITAARTISNPRDRIVTILLAPLMTCSARLPVYTLLISAFIPSHTLDYGLSLQGLVMFGLYMAGILSAMTVAWVLKVTTRTGRQVRPLLMELPTYRIPSPLSVCIGLWQRAKIFLRRVGGVIMTMTIGLWALLSFPSPPVGATGADIEYSLAGILGRWLSVLLEPIGFNWQISIALIPGLAAREVAVSSLGTVYALSGSEDAAAEALIPLITQQWSTATGMAMLAWYIFAPQCLPTFAAMKRETNGWKVPVIAITYMLILAYLAAWIAYRVTPMMLPTHLM
ncbi:ferrous iron transporter B [Orrella marina]|uniref:Fe(2+) transporter FeoB n=1 Tax=Orrella marina TaxID=2163011 RepID=A0A2R4XIV5_9BURK|nr:ferrous iron transporter B [Orrella marina]AWB33725.1 ferrous iron transporter B [Orrella marina]